MSTHSSSSPWGVAPAPKPGRRRAGAASVATLLALGLVPVLPWASPAQAAVTVGTNISVFPDRDMVVAVGYEAGEQLRVEVLRNDVVIGTTQGPAVTTPEGVGLEVNHGPLGNPLPGDCWTNFTPDIIGGDVIRVTAVGREGAPADTMTVKDVGFSGDPYLDANNNVAIDGTGATPLADIAVEFRRDKPDPRFRGGPFAPTAKEGGGWTATYRVGTVTTTPALTPDQQRQILLNEASWLAVVDNVSETTLAELGEGGGVAAGCTGSADPNTLVGGLAPINKATGDVTFSGTARAGVVAVSVTVGALGVKDATLTADANGGPSTWTLTVPGTEIATLPEGNVAVTPRFDALVGTARNVLKDTVAPAAPTTSPAAGTYASAQTVTLNKPTGEGTSKVYYEIGASAAAVPEPDEFSRPNAPITVTATQTIKGRLIDAAGNRGAVGTFTYQIGTPPSVPSGLRATAGDARVTLNWTGVTGAANYRIYRNGEPLPTLVAGTSYINTGLTNGTLYEYAITSLTANGIESARTGVVQATPQAAPAPDTTAPPAPGVNPTSGTYTGAQTLTATNTEAGVRFRYTRSTSATAPSNPSATNGFDLPAAGLSIPASAIVKVVAVDSANNVSPVVQRNYTISTTTGDTTPPPAPGVNPTSGTYTSARTLTATSSEAGVRFRYTRSTSATAPSNPTATNGFDLPAAGLSIPVSAIVKVVAVDAAGNVSPVVQRNYTISTTTGDTTPPPAPAVNPTSGTYTGARTLTATSSEAGVKLRYTRSTSTTAPSNPSATNGFDLPAGGLSIPVSAIVKVVAVDAAGNASTIVQRNYTIR